MKPGSRSAVACLLPYGRKLAHLPVAALVILSTCGGAAATLPDPLVLETTIPLPDVKGRIDHLAIDLARNRLFVAELGNDSVDVIDLVRAIPVKRIAGLKEPQGLGYLSEADELAVASGGDGTVRFYRGVDFTPLGVLPLGSDADNVRTEARSGRFVVGYGAGNLAIIDAATRRIVGKLPLSAHPEAFELAGDRVLVNVPDAGQIVSGDLTGRVIATWKTTHRANFPMALDTKSGTAAIGYRSPHRLATVNIGTGEALADVATCGDADDIFFDKKGRRAIVICGSGEIQLFGAFPGPFDMVGRTATRSGARTGLWVPEKQSLFVAVPASGGKGAEIRSYRFVS